MHIMDMYQGRIQKFFIWVGGPSPNDKNLDNVLIVLNLFYSGGPIGYSKRI